MYDRVINKLHEIACCPLFLSKMPRSLGIKANILSTRLRSSDSSDCCPNAVPFGDSVYFSNEPG
jgi:hypothetical protein